MLTASQIAWAAGFLEGEGSFFAGKRSQVTVSAVQVELAPLEHVVELFGGALKQYRAKIGRPFWKWTVNGPRAAEVAFTVYTWMSPKRRRQIERMLLVWRNQQGSANARKTHSPAILTRSTRYRIVIAQHANAAVAWKRGAVPVGSVIAHMSHPGNSDLSSNPVIPDRGLVQSRCSVWAVTRN
jgi:hypothetical protein